MIPKTAFAALCALAAVFWAFGFVCDRIIARWEKDRTDGSEDATADHDRWEDDPLPTDYCKTCKHDSLSWYDEPCDSCCGFSGWEEETK